MIARLEEEESSHTYLETRPRRAGRRGESARRRKRKLLSSRGSCARNDVGNHPSLLFVLVTIVGNERNPFVHSFVSRARRKNTCTTKVSRE